jgi:hypothetical protein
VLVVTNSMGLRFEPPLISAITISPCSGYPAYRWCCCRIPSSARGSAAEHREGEGYPPQLMPYRVWLLRPQGTRATGGAMACRLPLSRPMHVQCAPLLKVSDASRTPSYQFPLVSLRSHR